MEDFLAQHGLDAASQQAAHAEALHELAHQHSMFHRVYSRDRHPAAQALANMAYEKYSDAHDKYKSLTGKSMHADDFSSKCGLCGKNFGGMTDND